MLLEYGTLIDSFFGHGHHPKLFGNRSKLFYLTKEKEKDFKKL